MPLIKSKSPEAFSKNVSEMIKAGHPQKQALAAAYSIKRKFKDGGPVDFNRMLDVLAKRREEKNKKMEADEDFNTSPDLREGSSSLSNDTLKQGLSSSDMGRPDAEEAMYADGGSVKQDPNKTQQAQDSMRQAFGYKSGGIAYNKGLKEDEGQDPELIHNEEAYAKGGGVRIPSARSYVEYGDEMHDKDGNDLPHHNSLPLGSGKEDAFYKPKMIGNQGRQKIDLNMYAPGGKVKMAYGQGRSEVDQEDLKQTHDEDSSIAMAEGGIAYNANLKENYQDDTAIEPDENSHIAYNAGGKVAYTDIDEHDQADLKQQHNESSYAEGGEVEHAKSLEPDMKDTAESHDEDSSIAYAEGGSVDEERHLKPDDVDTKESKDEASSIAMSKGGPIQSKSHNPKSGEIEDDEDPKAKRRKLMMEALSE